MVGTVTTGQELERSRAVQLDRQHVWHHLLQHQVLQNQEPMIVVEGNGCLIKDISGREYLDCVSGAVWCVNVGYGRESIARVVYEQLKTMPYYAMTAGNIPAIQLAEKVTRLLPGCQRVFISNSGSEANEKAFKMARQYFRLKYPQKDKYKIIFRERDYHGTTLGALSATGQPERKMGYEPLVPGFVSVPPAYCYRCAFGKSYPGCDIDCARALEKVILQEGPESVAAFIVEPITAGGGVIPPVDEYFDIVQEICRRYEVLLIMDEVVCGFGRTGKWFGHQHWNVDPDMVTMAKGMASSYMPISATATKEYIFKQFLNDPADKIRYFRDISTYGGSAGACAAALENIRIIEDEGLLERVQQMGEYLIGRLRELEAECSLIGQVRGRGLFAGVELVKDRQTREPVEEGLVLRVLADAAAQGVLLGRTNRSIPGLNNTINIAPAYVVTREQIDRLVDTLRVALHKVARDI